MQTHFSPFLLIKRSNVQQAIVFPVSPVQGMATVVQERAEMVEPPATSNLKVSTTKRSSVKTKITVESTVLSRKAKHGKKTQEKSNQELGLKFTSYKDHGT